MTTKKPTRTVKTWGSLTADLHGAIRNRDRTQSIQAQVAEVKAVVLRHCVPTGAPKAKPQPSAAANQATASK